MYKRQEDTFAFLHEVIFSPLLKEEVFHENKEILLAKIKRMQDDPSQYAITSVSYTHLDVYKRQEYAYIM